MQRRSRGGRQSWQIRNPARAEQMKLNPTRAELTPPSQGGAKGAEVHQGGAGITGTEGTDRLPTATKTVTG